MNKLFKYTSLLALTSFLIVGCGQTPTPADPPSENPVLENISLSGNYETSFFVNDTFSYDGLVVTAHYSDSSKRIIEKNDYNVSTPDMSTKGVKDVTVTYLTKSKTYTITVSAKEIIPPEEEEEETYKGYLRLSETRLEIKRNSTTQYQVLPIPQGFEPGGIFPYEYSITEPDLITISKYGTVKSANNKNGTCIITCRCTDPNYNEMSAVCYVTVMDELPTKQKGWVRVDDYDSLNDGDILVMASPEHGVTASLNTLHSKLNPVESSFTSDKKAITSLGEGSIEFVLGLEDKGMTLEAQTGEYLVCTHQGKVKLDASSKTNKYWDIHSNIDPEEGTGSIDDGVVIENNVESLGYIMFNITKGYFSTYVDNSISKYMALPFLYRLQELN